MKHFNILLITLKIDAIKKATTEQSNQYAIINGIFEKQIKDKIFKTYYKCFIWDSKKMDLVNELKKDDIILVKGVFDLASYLVDGIKLDSGKDYYKQSCNINISSFELLPIPEQSNQKSQSKEEKSLSDDLDDEIPF